MVERILRYPADVLFFAGTFLILLVFRKENISRCHFYHLKKEKTLRDPIWQKLVICHISGIRCLTLTVFSNVGDEKVQRTDQDPDGFVNSEEETGVEVEGR